MPQTPSRRVMVERFAGVIVNDSMGGGPGGFVVIRSGPVSGRPGGAAEVDGGVLGGGGAIVMRGWAR